MTSEIPTPSKAYRWYVKTLIGCSILTGLSFSVHCDGKITPTTWLIFGNGRIGVGTDWAWIRRRFHPTSGVPSGEWTVRWAKPWEDVGYGDYWEFSLFALLLALWLVRHVWKAQLKFVARFSSATSLQCYWPQWLRYSVILPSTSFRVTSGRGNLSTSRRLDLLSCLRSSSRRFDPFAANILKCVSRPRSVTRVSTT